jgi:hypothetical protein
MCDAKGGDLNGPPRDGKRGVVELTVERAQPLHAPGFLHDPLAGMKSKTVFARALAEVMGRP